MYHQLLISYVSYKCLCAHVLAELDDFLFIHYKILTDHHICVIATLQLQKGLNKNFKQKRSKYKSESTTIHTNGSLVVSVRILWYVVIDLRYNQCLTCANSHLDFGRILKIFVTSDTTKGNNVLPSSASSKSISVECLCLDTLFHKKNWYIYSEILIEMCLVSLDNYFVIISPNFQWNYSKNYVWKETLVYCGVLCTSVLLLLIKITFI